MATKTLSKLEAEYAEIVESLGRVDRERLEHMTYDQLRGDRVATKRQRVGTISDNLLDAARLKRDIERKRAAGITS